MTRAIPICAYKLIHGYHIRTNVYLQWNIESSSNGGWPMSGQPKMSVCPRSLVLGPGIPQTPPSHGLLQANTVPASHILAHTHLPTEQPSQSPPAARNLKTHQPKDLTTYPHPFAGCPRSGFSNMGSHNPHAAVCVFAVS